MDKDKEFGIALSGGGFRAAIYHLGTLQKLKELGLLEKIKVISSNSGGSITAACYSLNSSDFKTFEKLILSGVQQNIILRSFLSLRIMIPLLITFGLLSANWWFPYEVHSLVYLGIAILIISIIFFNQFHVFPVSKAIENQYDKLFFKKKNLSDLSGKFKTTINSTNIETGRIFYFSQEFMGDSTYQYDQKLGDIFNQNEFPISRAVMASSAVPFVFTPVRINKDHFRNIDHYHFVRPRLIDGGIYDNQGIHKLTYKSSSSYCRNILVSDAGNFLPTNNFSSNTVFLLIRVSNLFMNRIKNFQMMQNIYARNPNSITAYQSLSFDPKDSLPEFIKMLQQGQISQEVIGAHEIDAALIKSKSWDSISNHIKNRINLDNILKKSCSEEEIQMARMVKTNLVPLSQESIVCLMKHAKVMTEVQLNIFLPHLVQNM